MPTFVALLRAINVSGKSKVAMADLRSAHEKQGHRNPVTVLQTGNVVFDADQADRRAIEDAYENHLGLRTTVILRSAEAFVATVEASPFTLDGGREARFLNVVFLTEAPARDGVSRLMEYVGPEETQVVGDALHVYYTEGVGRSKLTLERIERALGVSGTGRNWNTVSKLAGLVSQR